MPRNHVFIRDWIVCSNLLTNVGSVIKLDGGDLYDHLVSSKSSTLIMNTVFV